MSSTSLVVRDLHEDDREALDRFVGSNVFGDVMQSWEWGLVKAKGGDWRALRLGAFDIQGTLVGSISVLVRKFPVVGALYYAPRGPVLLNWADELVFRALLAEVEKRARAEGAALLKIDPALPVEQTAALSMIENAGFKPPVVTDQQGFGGTQPQTVMVLDIGNKTMDELLMACKPQCRRNIRICEKKGVEIVTDVRREDLCHFYDLLKVTAVRDGFGVRGLAYYESLWDELVPSGMGKVFLTKHDGQYLSGAFCFICGDKCVYVYGASSNENRNLMPNYGMQWAMIEWAKTNGCVLYDFRGVSPQKPADTASDEETKDDHLAGLNRFKEGFGARYVAYIGEFDLVYNKAAYWLWTNGRPKAQALMRMLRK